MSDNILLNTHNVTVDSCLSDEPDASLVPAESSAGSWRPVVYSKKQQRAIQVFGGWR